MNTSEKLIKTAQYAQETVELNNQLEQILYGTDTGGKSFYDEFWDNYQRNGSLSDYRYVFSGSGWSSKNFRPKYDIKPKLASSMFMMFDNLQSAEPLDLTKRLKDLGVVLDLNGVTGNNATGIFSYAKITRVPIIDLRNANMNQTFYQNSIVTTIDGIMISENVTYTNNAFQNCTSLVDLDIQGTIGQNGFNVQWSTKLSKASIISIINALSTTTTGLTLTLSKTAVNNAFETSEGLGNGTTSQEWLNLIATKSNWTISLV